MRSTSAPERGALQRRLLRHGALAEGTVLAVERTDSRVEHHFLWRLRYKYRDAGGNLHTGRSGYVSVEEAQGWHPGDIGGVRYDAAHPQRSVWIGYLRPTSAAE